MSNQQHLKFSAGFASCYGLEKNGTEKNKSFTDAVMFSLMYSGPQRNTAMGEKMGDTQMNTGLIQKTAMIPRIKDNN